MWGAEKENFLRVFNALVRSRQYCECLVYGSARKIQQVYNKRGCDRRILHKPDGVNTDRSSPVSFRPVCDEPYLKSDLILGLGMNSSLRNRSLNENT